MSERETSDRFGPYLIGERVGSGGMGVVYRATDLRVPRRVALKILRPGMAADPQFRERFRRESSMLSAAEHPHIVPMHNAGEIDGRLYLDMRLLDGDDLQSRLDRSGPLALHTVQAMIDGLADALGFVHGRGVLHRDIKPKNIMLTGFRDFAYLLDFGIALTEDEADLTGAHSVVGSMDYMSPERFTGRPADQRSDIYALTAVLVAAVTGRPPYPGRPDVAAAAHAHCSEPVPRPGRVDPRLAPLDEVVARGMAKDPADRFARARDLAGAAAGALDEVRARAVAPPLPAPPAMTMGVAVRPGVPAGARSLPTRSAPYRYVPPVPPGSPGTPRPPVPPGSHVPPGPPVPPGSPGTPRPVGSFGPFAPPPPSAVQQGRRATPSEALRWALAGSCVAAAGLLAAGLLTPVVAHASAYTDRHDPRDLATSLSAPALLVLAAVLFRAGRRALPVATGVALSATILAAAYLLDIVGVVHRAGGDPGPARGLVTAALIAGLVATVGAGWFAARRGVVVRPRLRSPTGLLLVLAGAATAVLAYRLADGGDGQTPWTSDRWSLGLALAAAATVLVALVVGGRALLGGALLAVVLHAAVVEGLALSQQPGRSTYSWLRAVADAAVVLGGLVALRSMRRPTG